jgi:DNA-binding MarR family transcriptional regulator
MKDKVPTQQRSLTDKQLDVLKLLYRFRFGTSDLISQAQGGISRQSTNARLTVLVEKELINKKQDGRAKLEGKPAIYSLAAKGRTTLRKQGDKYSDKVLNSIRANRDSSEKFVQHNLTIFSIANKLSELYGDDITFLTKSNIYGDSFDYLPESRPDAFLHIKSLNSYYFLYNLDDSTPDFALIRRVSPVFEHEKSGKWEVKTGLKLPSVLMVCSSNRLETTMRKRFAKLKSDEASDFGFVTTVVSRLLESGDGSVWRSAGGDDELHILG